MKLCLVVIALAVMTTATTPYPYALVHHPTSTKNIAAQRCFDRGLTLFYSYNRLASQRAFECAAKADPRFAMAYWGIALAHGSNINVTVDAAGEKAAYVAIHQALALQGNVSSIERGYINALATRYSNDAKPDLNALARSYARAMQHLSSEYPNDMDAAALYAESEMELQPWAWYTPDGRPVGKTNAILAVLNSVLSREPLHIGANHFNIHMTEESLHPERGLVSAGRIRGMNFEPAAAHLVHMPAHTYLRVGDYAAAAEVNERASMHDVQYLHDAHEADPEASFYHDHNLMMLAAAYANEGNWAGAKRAADMLMNNGAQVPAMFVYLRFNRWHDILNLPRPSASAGEPMRIPIWHFARGMALAGTGQLQPAKSNLAAVRLAKSTMHVPALAGWFNSSDDIFTIAENVLTAKIAAAQGRRSAEIVDLRSALAVQDNMHYIEPPDWYAPVRESLGAALFKAGNYNAAAAVFREDLRRNANNPRSLFGLYHSLSKLGDRASVSRVRSQFSVAWRNADTPLSLTEL